MARDTDMNPTGLESAALQARPEDRIPVDIDEPDTGRSNFVAFLLGGAAIAGGMLGFLYLDTSNNLVRDDITTGSIVRTETSPTGPTLKLPRQPPVER